MLQKVDKILEELVDMTDKEVEKNKSKGYFSKDFIEACGVVVSLAYGRWRRKN